MFRVSLANAFAKRTLRPLLEKHQATPVAVTLDADVTDSIYSGMVAKLNTDGTVGIADEDTPSPFGLFALDKNDVIDDTAGQPDDLATGLNGAVTGRPFAVWQGGPDAYFRVDGSTEAGKGAFDATQSYTVGDDLYAAADGRITNDSSGDGPKIGTVIETVSGTRLVIRVTLPAA